MLRGELTQGDTVPVVFRNFKDADGADIPTNMVATVQLSLKNQSGGAIPVNLAGCVITSSGSAPLVCEWRPGAADLNTAGTYDAELLLTYASGRVKRFPSAAGGFIVVVRPKTV